MKPDSAASYHIYMHSARDLEQLIRDIRSNKMTGALTINFSQGTPAGQLEWREKAKSDARPTSTLRSLVTEST